MDKTKCAAITKKGVTNMTVGSPLCLILLFGLPLILANTLQQVYSTVDTIILGRYGGVTGLAVLGTSSWPVWLSVSIQTNFSQASSLLIAKRFGSGDLEEMRRAIGNVLISALVLCLSIMVISQFLVLPALLWQNTPTDVMEQAILYLRITFGGIFILFSYNILAAFLRAVGDGKTPLLAIFAATAVNIVLDVYFVAKLNWGAPGAALATLIAQASSVIVCLLRIRANPLFRLEKRHFRLNGSILQEYISLAIPMLLQSCVIALGGFFVQAHINEYGSVFVAGMSATVKVFSLLETAAIALAQATATFVSQNYGCFQFNRIRKGIRLSIVFSLLIAALLCSSMMLFGRPLLSLFVTENAIDISWGLLVTMSLGLFIMYPMYVMRQSMQALGNALIPLLAAVIQLFARVLVTLLLPKVLGRAGLYFPTVVAWLTSLILIGILLPPWLKRCEQISGNK